MKIITLTEKEFNNYAYAHSYGTYYQSSYYGELMQKHGFQIHYIGFADDSGEIHAASLILYRNLFKIYKYAYAPRGFLIDYNDRDLLKLFTIKLKRLLRKQGFIFIKIDPFIIHEERYKDGNLKSEYNTHIINSLKRIGYIHQGYNKHFETLQPRCNAIVDLNKSLENLFFSFDQSIQNNIQIAMKNGISIYKGNREDIENLYDTSKDKYNNKLDFYFDCFDIFNPHDMIDIFYAKLDPSILLAKSQEMYDKESERNLNLVDRIQKNNENREDLINRKMESDELLALYKKNVIDATQLFNNEPDGLIIASTLVIKYNKTVYFILNGQDQRYKKFNASYLLKWLVMVEYKKQGYQYANLNGIHGDYEKKNKYDGLNELKLGFSNIATELIGEFDIPLKPVIYYLFKKSRLMIKFLLRTTRTMGTNKKVDI
jgi:lipid II:glycine glycyltransferase (peptidoglycan interpeptide bridge formation enzyme)